MTITLAPERTLESLNSDPEFSLASRYWNARLRLFIGADDYAVHIVDGVVTSVTKPEVSVFDSYTITVGGTEEAWEEILAADPRPFYQDFWSAYMRHGFVVAGDLELAYAYYPALRRMSEILRTIHNEGV